MRFFIPDTSMDVEEQEQKFRQSLDHLSHNTTQLANTLVCNVTERSPQLYLKTKLRLLNCIGSLTAAVVKVQQAWNELVFFRSKVGVPSTEEAVKPLLTQEEPEKKVSKSRKPLPSERRRTSPSKHKKGLPIPIKISVPLEEWMDDRSPLSFQSQTTPDKEDILSL